MIGAFSLAIGLGVKPGGEADRCANEMTKFLPELRRELRSPVRDNVGRKAVYLKDMID